MNRNYNRCWDTCSIFPIHRISSYKTLHYIWFFFLYSFGGIPIEMGFKMDCSSHNHYHTNHDHRHTTHIIIRVLELEGRGAELKLLFYHSKNLASCAHTQHKRHNPKPFIYKRRQQIALENFYTGNIAHSHVIFFTEIVQEKRGDEMEKWVKRRRV